MRKYSLFLLLSAASICANVGATDVDMADLIVGTWGKPIALHSKMGRISITYSADGSLNTVISMTIENHTVDETVAVGTWSVNGDNLTFVDEECDDKLGYYKIVSVDKNNLRLSLISDNCEGRGIEIADNWTRE